MALVTTGLTNHGLTTHYQIQYDDSLATADGKDRANGLIAQCENDFTLMANWFGGIALTVGNPITVNISPGAYASAGWGPPITLTPGNGSDVTLVRYLLVSEVTEMFMLAQNKGWFAPNGSNEGSAGEGLSRFLATQFLQQIGSGLVGEPGFDLANQWLNSARNDYVNHIDTTDHGIDDKTGCAILFIYYLFTQLGFSINQIVEAAAPQLSGVYQNLTGDAGDPFPFFKTLLETGFPGTSTITGGNLDNPFPLGILSFWVDKNTFSKDEVQDVLNTHGGRFNNAFWLVIEGFSMASFSSLSIDIAPITGAFSNLPGVTIERSATPPDFENPSHPNQPQRIRIAYNIVFTSAALASFPSVGSGPIVLELDAALRSQGNPIPQGTANTIFELTAGADPYFTNIDPSQNNVFWLSQDLRVFTATPARQNTPIPGGPVFTTDTIAGGFSYIQQLLTYLNTTYNDPSGVDPFVSVLPGQSGALAGDSSVSPVTLDWSNPFLPKLLNNYNFAIARVRLRGLAGDSAPNVKVFFRLWSTQTADTDFQPNDTYRSTTDAQGHPTAPLVGNGNHTLPFFASGNLGSNTDYGAGGVNNRTITLDAGDTRWAYFGCFLNLYDSANLVNGTPVQQLLNGTHHCLVAEIAYNDAPILNSAAVVLSPENSDKLAQRNLQVTHSDNPGGPASHRIPQTFDLRPSQPIALTPGEPSTYPDELMIDWGTTPIGSVGTIYWPQVNASEVLTLANQLYATHFLAASDAHTLVCTVSKGVTYVPIPAGTGDNFASLLTIDLPTTVVKGQEFNVIVRRLTTRRTNTRLKGQEVAIVSQLQTSTEAFKKGKKQANSPDALAVQARKLKNWRYVTGTFQVKIPVATAETLLAPELNTLSILKWRFNQLSPASRWYLVMQRYIQYLSARVDDLGGHSATVTPSPTGFWETPAKPIGQQTEYTGKVVRVLYDCFGDFEGFVLAHCCQEEHTFHTREKAIGELVLQACRGRFTISVLAHKHDPSTICKLMVIG